MIAGHPLTPQPQCRGELSAAAFACSRRTAHSVEAGQAHDVMAACRIKIPGTCRPGDLPQRKAVSMSDLSSKSLIVLKGLLFAGIAGICCTILVVQSPNLTTCLLLVLLIWSACRCYYFLFYVLEKYVDPTMRYAGLLDLLLGMRQRRRMLREQSKNAGN